MTTEKETRTPNTGFASGGGTYGVECSGKKLFCCKLANFVSKTARTQSPERCM